jgi:ATP-dependent helicase/nuclease subunit B
MINGVKQERYKYLGKLRHLLSINRELENLVESIHGAYKREFIKFTPPNPELHHRPSKLSVTDIAMLQKNAYILCVKKIFRLKELAYLEEHLNIRGKLLHKILDDIMKNSSRITDPVDKLSNSEINHVINHAMAGMHLSPTDFGLWFFRLKKIISLALSNLNRNISSKSEISGACSVQISENYQFDLHCVADRIDLLDKEHLAIIDYKTGSVPSAAMVLNGRAPQLPLEAIIANAGGFAFEQRKVFSLSFWFLNNSSQIKITSVTKTPEETSKLIEKTLDGVKKLVTKFNVEGAAYDVNVNHGYDQSYMHLARVKEWQHA